ncbi:MAG: hypothetical protein KGV44_05930 [Flavobacteriaceae bacterium]|nr:hypothetical protein [Flavobacteriaceae bacterium]
MMKNRGNILFVFEGQRTEDTVINSLQKEIFTDHFITCAFTTTMYKLYKDISEDEDLDLFSLLKEMEVNKNALKNYKREDFAEIYLFFDYDGHTSNADNKKTSKLLDFFNEETDKGKLYISYPMVEALKHIEDFDTFKNLKFPIDKGADYKKIVSDNCIEKLKHFNLYTFEIWKKVIDIHLRKMNYIVFDKFDFPDKLAEQLTVFNAQLNKYIGRDKTVSVLSAFPAFLHDYYGNKGLKNVLKK